MREPIVIDLCSEEDIDEVEKAVTILESSTKSAHTASKRSSSDCIVVQENETAKHLAANSSSIRPHYPNRPFLPYQKNILKFQQIKNEQFCTDFNYDQHLKDFEQFEEDLVYQKNIMSKNLIKQWLYEKMAASKDSSQTNIESIVENMMNNFDDAVVEVQTIQGVDSRVEFYPTKNVKTLNHSLSQGSSNSTDVGFNESYLGTAPQKISSCQLSTFGKVWQAFEKDKFFKALGVYSARESSLIAKYIGTDKTPADVTAYISILQSGLEKIRGDPNLDYLARFEPAFLFLSAREIPNEVIKQEMICSRFNASLFDHEIRSQSHYIKPRIDSDNHLNILNIKELTRRLQRKYIWTLHSLILPDSIILLHQAVSRYIEDVFRLASQLSQSSCKNLDKSTNPDVSANHKPDRFFKRTSTIQESDILRAIKIIKSRCSKSKLSKSTLLHSTPYLVKLRTLNIRLNLSRQLKSRIDVRFNRIMNLSFIKTLHKKGWRYRFLRPLFIVKLPHLNLARFNTKNYSSNKPIKNYKTDSSFNGLDYSQLNHDLSSDSTSSLCSSHSASIIPYTSLLNEIPNGSLESILIEQSTHFKTFSHNNHSSSNSVNKSNKYVLLNKTYPESVTLSKKCDLFASKPHTKLQPMLPNHTSQCANQIPSSLSPSNNIGPTCTLVGSSPEDSSSHESSSEDIASDDLFIQISERADEDQEKLCDEFYLQKYFLKPDDLSD